MPDDFDMTPEGVKTQDGIRRYNEAEQAFSDATAQVANLLTDLLGGHDNMVFSLRLLREQCDEGFDEDDIEAAHRAVTARQAAQEELLRSICGAPPMPKDNG